MRARPLAILALVGVGLLAAGACTGDGDGQTGEVGGLGSTATDDLGEPVVTVPAEDALPAAVAARLLRDIPRAIGVALLPDQVTCAAAALDAVDPDALRRLGMAGVLLEQPLVVQAAVFDAFDDCIDPAGYARAASPILVLAGVDRPTADCVTRALREDLQFSGMYVYALSRIGEAPPDPRIDDTVGAAYAGCDLDPTALTVPTGPTTTTIPGQTTVVTTTTVPTTGTETIPVTTTEPPIEPPDDVIASSIPTIPTGTLPPTTAAPSTTRE